MTCTYDNVCATANKYGLCEKCHSTCPVAGTCTDTSNGTCDDSATAIASNLCPPSTHLKGGSCASCHATCEACLGPAATDCTTCKAGLNMKKLLATQRTGRCECGSPATALVPARGQWFDVPNGACAACDAKCLTCEGFGANCTTCHAHTDPNLEYELNSTSCAGECVCKLGYEIDTDVACRLKTTSLVTDCYGTCRSCSVIAIANKCFECMPGSKNVDDNNNLVDGTECKPMPGYYLKAVTAPYPVSNTIEQCNLDNCPECEVWGKCTKCHLNMFVNTTFVCQCKEGYEPAVGSALGCVAKTNTINGCKLYHYLPATSNLCLPCHFSCETCINGDEWNCITCKKGREFDPTATGAPSCQIKEGFFFDVLSTTGDLKECNF
jgi:proprotein convertase subtilisin/kexin type 5